MLAEICRIFQYMNLKVPTWVVKFSGIWHLHVSFFFPNWTSTCIYFPSFTVLCTVVGRIIVTFGISTRHGEGVVASMVRRLCPEVRHSLRHPWPPDRKPHLNASWGECVHDIPLVHLPKHIRNHGLMVGYHRSTRLFFSSHPCWHCFFSYWFSSWT